MKRKIIKIDEEKCNGCGLCIPNCPEGALQIIDGKVRLVSDLFCDGLGACLGHCPEGAIEVEERDAEPYDEKKVMINVARQGMNVIKAHLKHLKDHNEMEYLNQAFEYLREGNITIPEYEKKSHVHSGGCPGSKMLDLRKTKELKVHSDKEAVLECELQNWPIQLQLLNPQAPYLKNAELTIVADCVPFAYPNFHQKFLKGKILIIFCPKLDTTTEDYIEKLADIFKNQDIKSIDVIHMEVPCCFGVEQIVSQALERAGVNIKINEITITRSGEIRE